MPDLPITVNGGCIIHPPFAIPHMSRNDKPSASVLRNGLMPKTTLDRLAR